VSRRLLPLLLLVLAALLWAPAALAARPSTGPQTLTTERVAVHFTGDPAADERFTFRQAADLAAYAEQSLTALASWGYPLPLDDGDGRVDIWVTDLRATGEEEPLYTGLAFAESSGGQATGFILLHFSAALEPDLVMHELFHLSQNATWRPMSTWLKEATADWAGQRFAGFPAVPDAALGPPDMSLDCEGDGCGGHPYYDYGYSRWPFFQYTTERFGSGFVQEIFARGQAVNDATVPALTLLQQVLAARGTTVSSVFADFSVARMTGAFAAPSLARRVPTIFAGVDTGTTNAELPTLRVAVNHLAARYVAFRKGPANEGEPCFAATLKLSVAVPAGVSATPHFFWTGGDTATATPFAVSGSTASLDVPWDTCTWPGRLGIVSLTNASLDLDARTFVLSSRLVVDRSRPATATAPPAGWMQGPVVEVPTVDPAPTVSLFGPSLLTLGPSQRSVRLLLFSSGPGKLEASFGGRSAGSFTLRSGNNLLTLRVPAAVGRRQLSLGTRLQLTTTDATGVALGKSVSRTVRIVRAPAR